jgi:hypothetical protein
MRSKYRKAWTEFRAMPGIVQFGAWLALVFVLAVIALPSPAAAQQPTVDVEAICKDGKLVALRIVVPGPGIVTLPMPIPQDLCSPHPEKQPTRQA